MSSAIDLLKRRSGTDIIQQKYVQRVLEEEAESIKTAQDKIFNNLGASAKITQARIFTVTDGILSLSHNIRQRFDDMKTTRGKKQKSSQAHNRVVWGHFNTVVFKLAYGLTTQVKEQIATQYNIEI